MKLVFFFFLFLGISKAQTDTIDNLNRFFDEADVFLSRYVDAKGMVDYQAIMENPSALEALGKAIKKINPDSASTSQQKAFYINAYNLSVLIGIIKHYPLTSPLKVPGLFDVQVFEIAEKKMTLSDLEKKLLLSRFKDARLHFVLNCAALGCPRLANFAYRPDSLEIQLAQQTQHALEDADFLRIEGKTVWLSQIFEWYAADFSPSIRAFIDKHRSNPLDKDFTFRYYPYDWNLNDRHFSERSEHNVRKFVPIVAANTLPRGRFELKSFNGIYSAKYPNTVFGAPLRSSFFSGFIQLSYGLTGRLDLGLDLLIRSNVLGDFARQSAFRVFTLPNGYSVHADKKMQGKLDSISIYKASGLSHIAARLRWSPFKKISGFSLQQTFYIPVQKTVDGSWLWVTDLFFAHNFSPKTQLFIAFTVWQPIYPGQKFRLNQPYLKAFFTWLPNNRFSVYATTTWLYEWGGGMKFLILPGFEIELLATRYLPFPFIERYFGIGAGTVNVGCRFRF